MEEYTIKAIAGTVEINYQNIPFFSAHDVFDDEKLPVLKRILSQELSMNTLTKTLSETLTTIDSSEKCIRLLQKIIHQIQIELKILLEKTVDEGIVIHLAFLIDALRQMKKNQPFPQLEQFMQRYEWETHIIQTNLKSVEQLYQIDIPEAEIARITQMFLENQAYST